MEIMINNTQMKKKGQMNNFRQCSGRKLFCKASISLYFYVEETEQPTANPHKWSCFLLMFLVHILVASFSRVGLL